MADQEQGRERRSATRHALDAMAAERERLMADPEFPHEWHDPGEGAGEIGDVIVEDSVEEGES